MHDIDVLFADQSTHQASVLPHRQRILRIGVHVNDLAARALDAKFQLSTSGCDQGTATRCTDRFGDFKRGALNPADIQAWYNLQDRQRFWPL